MNTIIVIGISLIVNIIIAIVGVVPSIFITAFNIHYFGIGYGLILCIIGESLGAIASFYIYRKGFKKISLNKIPDKYLKILNMPQKEQMKMIFSFRIFPYVPSGLITYLASITEINIWIFATVSTIGKIPAIFIEVLIVGGILNSSGSKKIELILTLIGILIIIKVFKKVAGNNEK